jgi:hypothetical protein
MFSSQWHSIILGGLELDWQVLPGTHKYLCEYPIATLRIAKAAWAEEPHAARERHNGMSLHGLIRVLLGMCVMLAFGAGCAARPAGKAPTIAAPPTSSGGAASLCPPPAGATVTVAETDSGRTLCARVSQRIEVYLHGTATNPWSAITAAGDLLRPTANGKLSLAVGVTGAVFTAVGPGQVELVSTRPTCTGQHDGSECNGPAEFRVTLSVGD